MPVTHVGVLRAGAPVDGSTLEALVAACTEPTLVQPALCLARLGVHQVQCVSVIVLSVEVSLAAIAASSVEVPTGNDVGLLVDGSQRDVVVHLQQFA